MNLFEMLVWLLAETGSLCLWKKFGSEKFEKTDKFFVEIGLLILSAVCGFFASKNVMAWFDLWKLLSAYIGMSIAVLTDIQKRLIPNNIVIVMFSSRVIIFVLEIFYRKEQWAEMGLNSLIGASIAFVSLLLLSIVTKGGLGMGDVKLLTALGFLCGLYMVLNTLCFGLISCCVYSGIMLALKKKNAKDKIAFGPFLYIGYVISVILGAF